MGNRKKELDRIVGFAPRLRQSATGQPKNLIKIFENNERYYEYSGISVSGKKNRHRRSSRQCAISLFLFPFKMCKNHQNFRLPSTTNQFQATIIQFPLMPMLVIHLRKS